MARYCLGAIAYAGGYQDWDKKLDMEQLSPEQRAVFETPYHIRLDRPVIGDDARLVEGMAAEFVRGSWQMAPKL